MITITQNIPFITPSENDFFTKVTSNNTTKTNFRYLFDIYTGTSATGIPVATRALLPRPTIFNCEFSPNAILRNFITYDRGTHLITNDQYSNYSYTQYVIGYGEQYQYFFEFDDNFFASAFAAFSAYSGYIGFTSATNVHLFNSGDTVYIQQQAGATNPQYNGSHTILFVPDNHSFIIDVFGGSATPAETGTTIYADYSSTNFTGLTFFSGDTFKSAIQLYDQPSWNHANYIMSGTSGTKLFLTNQPRDGVYIRDNQQASISFINTRATVVKHRVTTYQRSGGTLTNTGGFTNITPGTNKIVHMYAGVWNVNQRFGAGTIDVDRDYKYTITLLDGTSNCSESITYLIDDECAGWDVVRLKFFNKLAGYDYINFKLKSYERTEVERKNFNKILSSSFSVGDRGATTNLIKSKKRYTVYSDRTDNDTARWIVEDLLESPEVYWLQGEGEATVEMPIDIITTGDEIKKTENTRNNFYEIQFYLAYDRVTQLNG